MTPRLPPQRIAPDTWVPGILHRGAHDPVGVHVNSMIITGSEPVLVDTGETASRDEWSADAWSVVAPTDVRWIFLTHEEPDHAGNLLAALDACPQATVVTSWYALERLSHHQQVPLERCRWVNDGEGFDAGDRTLRAVRPPVFDSPTTRGLYDPTTGVYWAADAFAVPVTTPTLDADDLDHDEWREGTLRLHRVISAWHSLLDPDRYRAAVARVRVLQPRSTCSNPYPDLPAVDLPTQYDLDTILGAVRS